MNKNKRASSGPVVHIGTSFLLVIFIILCLVTFAVLSLSSALKDQNYSQKEAARTTAYYEANGLAQEKLSEVVAAFKAGTLDQVTDVTTQKGTSTESGSDFVEASYSIPMDNSQMLEVSVELSTTNNLDNGNYQIIKWKEVSSSDWNGSSTLPVMDSGELE